MSIKESVEHLLEFFNEKEVLEKLKKRIQKELLTETSYQNRKAKRILISAISHKVKMLEKNNCEFEYFNNFVKYFKSSLNYFFLTMLCLLYAIMPLKKVKKGVEHLE